MLAVSGMKSATLPVQKYRLFHVMRNLRMDHLLRYIGVN
jgi:hypothetical protein